MPVGAFMAPEPQLAGFVAIDPAQQKLQSALATAADLQLRAYAFAREIARARTSIVGGSLLQAELDVRCGTFSFRSRCGPLSGDRFACPKNPYDGVKGQGCGVTRDPYTCATDEHVCGDAATEYGVVTCTSGAEHGGCVRMMLFDCATYKCGEYECPETLFDFNCSTHQCSTKFTCSGTHVVECRNKFQCSGTYDDSGTGATACTGDNAHNACDSGSPYSVPGGEPGGGGCAQSLRFATQCTAGYEKGCESGLAEVTCDPKTSYSVVKRPGECELAMAHTICPPTGAFKCLGGAYGVTAGCSGTTPHATCSPESSFNCTENFGVRNPSGPGTDVTPGDSSCGVPNEGALNTFVCSQSYQCRAHDDFDCFGAFTCGQVGGAQKFTCGSGDDFVCFKGLFFDCAAQFACSPKNAFVCQGTRFSMGRDGKPPECAAPHAQR
jgi:hypothetical protein